MYQQPYDPYGFQSYNGPQPDHYTSTVPGMPYPAPPPSHERYPAAEQPYPSGDHSYTTYQEQYYNSANNYDPPPYGSQSYSSQPSHYPPNPTLSTSPPEQYPPAYPSLSHSSSNHYPPMAQTPTTVYPSVSNSSNSTQDAPLGAGSYSRPGTPYPTDSPLPSATESSWLFGYGTKSDSAPSSAPPHLNSTYDSNRPNPYIKIPATSNVHGKYDEQHDRFGMPSAPVPSKSEMDRHDSGGCKVKQKLHELKSQALPKREDKKENVSFSVEEAQHIIKHLKETIKNLNLQLTNSRDSTMKLVQEKDALNKSVEQLQKETEYLRAQSFVPPPAFDHTEAIAVVEREWMQKLNLKDQEKEELLSKAAKDTEVKHSEMIANLEREWVQKLLTAEQERTELQQRLWQLTQEHAKAIETCKEEWAERHSLAEEENVVLLARVTKLQADSETGHALLLETNASQEAELMKLRDETAQLLDETTQLVDERDSAHVLIERLEGEKQELENLLSQTKGSAADQVEHERATALENVAVLEKELKECQDLCEKRRLQIEELEAELPSLNSDLELEKSLHKKSQDMIAELEDKLEAALADLEDCKQDCDSLEQQLNETEKREMETNLRVAGETRSAKEELEIIRSQLHNHLSAKGGIEKSLADKELEKRALEGKLAELEIENRTMVDSISRLQKTLEDVSAERDTLQEEMGLIRETLDRETQEAGEASANYRLDLERLEGQISTITSEKSSLQIRVTHLESGKIEAEKLLRITEEMLEAVKEESESLKAQIDSHSAVIGDKDSQADKALLEKLADLEDENEQCAEIISQLEKDLKRALREKDLQLEKVKTLEDETSRLRKEVENRESLMMKIQEESGIAEAELNETLEELTKLELKTEADQVELKRLRSDIKDFLRAKEEALDRVKDLEETRADLEEKLVAVVEDAKRAKASAGQMGAQVCELETEYRELQDRYSSMSLQYAEVQAQRDELVLSNRNLRNK